VSELNWQIVATVAFIAIAIVIVLRRLIRLLASPAAGCGAGCNGCAKQAVPGSGPTTDGFVSLDSLVKAGSSLKESKSGN
jgi:hypothetical protein